jgi:cytochrome c-type biogenesis protein CcmE
MKNGKNTVKIIAATVVVVGVIVWLAVSGMNSDSNKSYYVTIAEMRQMGEKTFTRNLRVEGFVKPESIVKDGSNVTFTLTQFESHDTKATPNPQTLVVRYKGAEPPPDTFKDDAQALAVGKMGRDGVFHATELQAKCASKYQAAPGTTPNTAASPATSARPAGSKS